MVDHTDNSYICARVVNDMIRLYPENKPYVLMACADAMNNERGIVNETYDSLTRLSLFYLALLLEEDSMFKWDKRSVFMVLMGCMLGIIVVLLLQYIYN